MQNKTQTVKTSDIVKGDTILLNGQALTVGAENIKNDSLFGISIHGENFIASNRMVERVLFPKWSKGEFSAWYTQI